MIDYKNINILFATPCFNGNLSSETALGYLNLSRMLHDKGINHEIKFLINSSLITKGRNILSAHFMENKSFTHLMFIDADIGFNPKTFFSLLEKNKSLSGCGYPAKKICWDNIYQNLDKIKTKNDLINYSGKHLGYPQIENKHDNSIEETKFLGTGFMLIKRQVFLKMIENEPNKFYKPDYPIDDFRFKNKKHYMFFENGLSDIDTIYRGEDFHFCEKWRNMGGKVWILNHKEKLHHIGKYTY